MSGYTINTYCNSCKTERLSKPFNAHEMNQLGIVCEKCGAQGSWEEFVERWISTFHFFKPWTWFSGYWERK